MGREIEGEGERERERVRFSVYKERDTGISSSNSVVLSIYK